MMTTPALDTVVQSMMDSTELKNGAARKTKKKPTVPTHLKANSPAEEADEKRRGIKDTPQEEAAETKADAMNKILLSRNK